MINKFACITLDLEPDYASNISISVYDGWSTERITALLSLLAAYNAPLSVFIVGKTLSKHGDIIRMVQRYRADFHIHSYSHNIASSDTIEEIIKSKKAYKDFFHRNPVGYRAPQGKITADGLTRLKTAGFLFDASVFPSIWPNPQFFLHPRIPCVEKGSGIMELPFATITPMRIIFSLSWVKLLGFSFFSTLIKKHGLPQTIIFNLHLHDLWCLSSYPKLSPFWRFIYGKNKHMGMIFLDKTLALLRESGYTFITMSQLYQHTAKRGL